MSERKVGDKVVIKGDSVAHGFPVGTEVYLVGQEDSRGTTWLASEDRDAEAVWTGRGWGAPEHVVMNVGEEDMESVSPQWHDIVAGDKVTVRLTATGEEVTSTAYADGPRTRVLGWQIQDGAPWPNRFTLVSIEKAPKPEPFKLPTTLYSQIEVTFIGAEQREVRHCVLVRNADGDFQWLIVSMDGKPVSAWHDARWLEEGVNRPVPMYEIEVLFEAEGD